MAYERELVISKGEEFKLNVRGKIVKTDIFYDQYIAAAKMLDDIVARKGAAADNGEDKFGAWCKTEYENNIIAFCGERGEGKSSAMISFINAAYESNKNARDSIFINCQNVKETYFAEPVVIDPSMFDGVHNVLDIVLATLYKKFKDQYEKNNQLFYSNNREELLDRFQKVYKCISLINNQEKMLDDEYDYEGNISKLSKLGQSTELRGELEKLIALYLNVMMAIDGAQEEKKSARLLISIDDLDLCSSHVYKMTEQIRKYLILPNIVIVMAVKIEQLELCVQEKNLRNYKNVMLINEQRTEFSQEVTNMSERYVAKLIPKARRNYLPNVHLIHNLKISYKDRNGENILVWDEDSKVDSIDGIILHLIYEKTGMKFLVDKSGKNYFMPDNLRDTVNMITFLADMKSPESKNEIYYDNIQKFSNYFERQWLPNNLNLKLCKEIQKLLHAQSQVHESAVSMLYECHILTKKKSDHNSPKPIANDNDRFLFLMNWLEIYRTSVFGEEERKYAYVFHILYTIRLNKLLRLEQHEELINFIGGYVWGENFQNILPLVQGTNFDRSRFKMSTLNAFNKIATEIYPNKKIVLQGSVNAQYYVTEIEKKDENRKFKIVVWLLLGMLSNTFVHKSVNQSIFTFDSVRIVSANHSIIGDLYISLENYIVSLCNLKSIYNKVNMEYLGIEEDELNEVIDEIERTNKGMIEVFRKIVSNIDIAMEFKEYCRHRRGIKESGNKNEVERAQEAVNRFFNHTEAYVKENFSTGTENLNCLKLKYDNDKTEINISKLYASLVQAGIEEIANSSLLVNTGDLSKRKEEIVNEFASKLRDRTGGNYWTEKVSAYLVTKTAKNAKRNMDNLASNIQKYYSEHGEEKMEESEIADLCSFYGKVIDIYLVNPVEEISEGLCIEYKQIAKRYRNTY